MLEDEPLQVVMGERRLAAATAAANAAALAVAFGSERWLGLVPCAFCLLERRPYQAGLLLGLAGCVLPRREARLALWAAVAMACLAAGLSAIHVGVERHWWPDPLPACTVPDFTGMTASQRLAAMPSRPAKPCEDPDFLIPGLPLSMATLGLVYALALCVTLAMSLTWRRKAAIDEPAR